MKTSRSLFLAVLITFTINAAYAQTTANIYNPSADASAEISAAVLKAKAENKHVLLQVGGNWCSWCVKFHKLIHTDTKIDSVMKANYIFVLVNHSKENRNYPLLKELEFPQRFGFPVLVVLNPEGKRIHTQATDLLESGDGYDNKKVISFLKLWSAGAVDPAKYPDKQ